jgi:ubiquitin-activating enzyme E1 C
VNERVHSANVTGYNLRVEDLSTEWLASFDLCCLGLDSIEARAHVNALLCGVAEYDSEGNPAGNIVPMVDGGTEGFKGHARVIVPGLTPCFECTRWLFPPQESYPLCTLAETPRNPEHCIEYAHLILWHNERSKEKFDGDNSEHIDWVYSKALERAKMFGIDDVTRSKTQGVVKNIIPAVPSTNAIVASVCALEAVKLVTSFSQSMNNFTMYTGTQSVYTHTAPYERDPNCIVCSPGVPVNTTPASTLGSVIDHLKSKHALAGPSSVTHGGKRLYMGGMFHEDTKDNFEKQLNELLGTESGHKLIITDNELTSPMRVRLVYDT